MERPQARPAQARELRQLEQRPRGVVRAVQRRRRQAGLLLQKGAQLAQRAVEADALGDVEVGQHVKRQPHRQEVDELHARRRRVQADLHRARARRLEPPEHAGPARELQQDVLDEGLELLVLHPEFVEQLEHRGLGALRGAAAQALAEAALPRRAHRVARGQHPLPRRVEAAPALGHRPLGLAAIEERGAQRQQHRVHEIVGIKDLTLQSLYHFTIGGPVDDGRLLTLPAYYHLQRG